MITLAVVMAAAACGQDDRRIVTRDPDSEPPRGTRRDPDAAWTGPPMELEVVELSTYPVQWAAIVRTTAPTTAHRFRLDEARVEDGRLHLYTTLEEPSAEDEVKNEPTRLQVWHGMGSLPIDHMELWARFVPRELDGPPPPYVLVAQR